jgi:hypothetical protein
MGFFANIYIDWFVLQTSLLDKNYLYMQKGIKP